MQLLLLLIAIYGTMMLPIDSMCCQFSGAFAMQSGIDTIRL